MSMYTELLHAAVGDRGPVVLRPTRDSALYALRRSRRELDEGTPPVTDPDAVPVVLAREVAYDVALVDLAELMGIETDLQRFEQPRLERARLEEALRESGITSRPPTGVSEATRPAQEPAARRGALRYRLPRFATPGSIAR
jgi:hypothetical protein